MSKKERIICGLDIGTTKVCMMIARPHNDGRVEIISSGYAQSTGLKKGLVTDLDEAAASIRKAAHEAELKSGMSVDWVTVGVSGDHIQSYNCHGATGIEGKHQEVTTQDVDQVIQAAQSIPIPPEREVIHVLPQEFFLDNRGGIQKPIGLTGSRLDVNVHVVTCESALNQNIINAVNRAQMRVRKVVLQQLASAEAVLTPDEKEFGAAVVDIGGGTTDIGVFSRGAIRFSSVIPVGGAHFSRDLAVGLRTPYYEADRIKRETGTVTLEGIAGDEMCRVPAIGAGAARDLPRQMIAEILRARGVELMEVVKDQLLRAGDCDELAAGVVFTGGASMLSGILETAEQVLELPVRQGIPLGVHGLSEELSHPVYSTAIGLTIIGALESLQMPTRARKTNSEPWSLNRILSWVGN